MEIKNFISFAKILIWAESKTDIYHICSFVRASFKIFLKVFEILLNLGFQKNRNGRQDKIY